MSPIVNTLGLHKECIEKSTATVRVPAAAFARKARKQLLLRGVPDRTPSVVWVFRVELRWLLLAALQPEELQFTTHAIVKWLTLLVHVQRENDGDFLLVDSYFQHLQYMLQSSTLSSLASQPSL